MTRLITYYVPLTGSDIDLIKCSLEAEVNRLTEEPGLMEDEVIRKAVDNLRTLLKRLG